VSGWQPRQARAVETRKRILDAAMAEMERVGVEAARIEDIVAIAGVAWGSFYRYFPTKEDLLLDAAATVAQVFADACEIAATSGRPAAEIIIGAFWKAASAAPTAPPLREATFRSLVERPERLGELLAARRVPPPVDVLAEVIDAGQRRGELHDDHPAPFLAGVILTAVWANALRDVMTTRLPPAGSGIPTSRRGLAVTLLVDGLRKNPPDDEEPAPRPPLPERIGRRASSATTGERPPRPAKASKAPAGD
jgi:AcrR family transcriptional regulator